MTSHPLSLVCLIVVVCFVDSVMSDGSTNPEQEDPERPLQNNTSPSTYFEEQIPIPDADNVSVIVQHLFNTNLDV